MTALQATAAKPAKPARWAADSVSILREGARLRLDHSPQSLWSVDRVIAELRCEDPPYEAVAQTLRGFGAYAGEVLIRELDAVWEESAESYRLRTPDGTVWDPIGEARRTFEAEGSLRLLCLDAMHAAR
ncbi:hypothetical protein [Streptomyces cavernicola]|uniref:Uncharacterized protein n=1 Tax=Streptomyces cavernicola TaxID=3043613 RepID=A0ABT6SB45_9ACTN|nr:hypothetical protein [Streptomyces sp. B-S-A6]MDI3405425.1 hypothetical protein [Streptomyces sp. B-S-A6]